MVDATFSHMEDNRLTSLPPNLFSSKPFLKEVYVLLLISSLSFVCIALSHATGSHLSTRARSPGCPQISTSCMAASGNTLLMHLTRFLHTNMITEIAGGSLPNCNSLLAIVNLLQLTLAVQGSQEQPAATLANAIVCQFFSRTSWLGYRAVSTFFYCNV